jgi:hypothetical protein
MRAKMPLKLSIKIPSSFSEVFRAKVRASVDNALDDARPKIVALIVDRVTSAADTALQSQADVFKRAIQDSGAITLDESGVKVHIKDPKVLSLDAGYDAFDIKAKMLPHAKRFSKKGEPFIDVPFTHRPYGRDSAGRGGVPKSVLRTLYKQADKVAADVNVRSNIKSVPRSFERTMHFGEQTIKMPVQHKTGLYTGMIYSRQSSSQGTFKTLRRISGASDPSSWWHPGFRGVGIFRKVFNQLRGDTRRVLRDSFARNGLRVKLQ